MYLRIRKPEPITDERRQALKESFEASGISPFAPRPTLHDIYIECVKEAGGTSAFAELMGTEMYRTLIDSFDRWSGSNWRSVVDVMNVKDFRPHKMVWVSGAEDLLLIGEAGHYEDSRLFDHEASLSVDTYGRMFSLNRKTIINDDLNGLAKWPKAAGVAANRKIAKMVFQDTFLANPNAFDGAALFNNARTTPAGVTVDNLDTTTALTEANLEAAITKFEKFVDHDTGEPMGLQAKRLVVGPDLRFTAERILKSTERTAAAGSGTKNTTEGVLELVVEPYMAKKADGTATSGHWMLLPDPADCPVVSVGALNGNLEPDLLVKVDANNLNGGADPYQIEFDEIVYKVRMDAGVGVSSYYAYAATSAAAW